MVRIGFGLGLRFGWMPMAADGVFFVFFSAFVLLFAFGLASYCYLGIIVSVCCMLYIVVILYGRKKQCEMDICSVIYLHVFNGLRTRSLVYNVHHTCSHHLNIQYPFQLCLHGHTIPL